MPFWPLGPADRAGKRVMHPPGWLETNVVQFGDPDHIWHDPQQRTFHLWMRAHTESMIHPDRMGSDRYNLPNNERHILGLHFSKNCMDWCFAGVVARGDTPLQARHYATMVIDNDDLLVLSRSGDHRAKSAHDGNLITLHRVRDFRGLVYI